MAVHRSHVRHSAGGSSSHHGGGHTAHPRQHVSHAHTGAHKRSTGAKPRKSSGAKVQGPDFRVARGVLSTFDSVNYLATLRLDGSSTVYLSNVSTSWALPSGRMVAGAVVFVALLDEHNPADAMVIAVH